MTKSDKWKKRPQVLRYFQFKDDLLKHVKGTLEPRFEATFYMPMPKSWSAKKRELMDGMPHQQRPDVDNILKSLMDALCEDDSYIYDVRATKRWGQTGRIVLTELDAYGIVPAVELNQHENKRPNRKVISSHTNSPK